MSASAFHPLRSSRRLWWLVVTAGVLTLVFGTIGNWLYEHDPAHDPAHAHATHPVHPVSSVAISLYHAVQMLILHTPHYEKGANHWIVAGSWLGAFTLITTSGVLLWRRFGHEFRMFLIASWTGHHVVCGLGQKGLEVVRSLKCDQPDAHIVVIDREPHEHLAEECARLGVGVIEGDATSPAVLRQARVEHAGEIVVLTPEDETNVRIALRIRELANTNQTQATCFVHLGNIHLRERLERQFEDRSASGLTLRFFDVFDDEARRVLLELPLDDTGIGPDDPRTVHVVLVGFGRMGRSLALRAAKLGHFANGKPLRISILDRHADLVREHFLFHYPVLDKEMVGRLTFHQADAQSLTARRWIEGWAAEPDTLLHVFVCLDDNALAAEAGLRLREALAGHPDCHLRVRIKTKASLAGIFEQAGGGGPRVVPFGMVENACCDHAFRHSDGDAVARAIHERFVQKLLATSQRTPANDPALRDWHDLREDIRESNRLQADHIGVKLRALGCQMVKATEPGAAVETLEPDEIACLAPVEHERWNAERWLAGWRYGTPSNKERRISENLKPWKELDGSIRQYDEDAVADIPAVLRQANPPLKVVRKNQTRA